MAATAPAASMLLPAAGQVHLWLMQEWGALSADRQVPYAEWLNAGERARWQRFRAATDRQRFLQARALVRSVLAGYLQLPPASVEFAHNQYGKPQLLQQPAPLQFNLSHTHGLLALVVTRDADAGVDVEAVTREVEILTLAQRFFAPAETALIKACSADAQRDLFFRLWTLKEAYVKARGLGLQLGLDSFAFHFDTAGRPQLSLDESGANASSWSFMQLQHAERFQIALAVQAAGISNAQLKVFTAAF